MSEPEAGAAASLPGRLVQGFRDRMRSGDIGLLPVFFALILITIFFQAKNSNFLSAGNFNNLIVQMAGIAILAMGVVFVLLVGEIDLSIGYVSGIGGVLAAELVLEGGRFYLPEMMLGSYHLRGVIAITIAVIAGVVIGFAQGWFVAIIGVPSFVVTLAGLLIWQGVLLQIIGDGGTVVVQDQSIIDTANYFFSDSVGYFLATAACVLFAVGSIVRWTTRKRMAVASESLIWMIAKIVGFTVVAFFVVHTSNNERGFPLAGLILLILVVFWSYVAERTVFGRHVYAVGGSAEAARRAGINVSRVRICVFMISSGMAAFGGVVLASRLASVSPDAGGGTLLLDAISAAVIGGTSLFGGRGTVRSALLGALVVASVANGISLVGYPAAVQYMVTGLILLAAVTIDTVSRRRLAATGR